MNILRFASSVDLQASAAPLAPASATARMAAYAIAGGGLVATLEFARTRASVPADFPALAWLGRLFVHWTLGVLPLAAGLVWLESRAPASGSDGPRHVAAWLAGVAIGVALLALEAARGEARIDVLATGAPMRWQDRALYVSWPLAFWGFVGCCVHAVIGRRAQGESRRHAAHVAKIEAERGLAEHRLAAIRAQIEPEFVLDAVTALQPLYASDRAAAERALDALIDFLRASLVRLRRPHGNIAEECALAASYAATLLSAAGGMQAVRVDVARDVADAEVAPGLLLPLVQHLLVDPERCASASLAATRTWDGIDLRLVAVVDGGTPPAWLDHLPRLEGRLMMTAGPRARAAGVVGGATRAIVVQWPLGPRDVSLAAPPAARRARTCFVPTNGGLP
jgi:hypothetical protein